ncbi:MAG: T9SS type A sorting domain-containing protein [Bacteroidetes bacterium]|nr:T9SS type A sorting domain-containing protein [Bacteroidota bacterium]
MKKQIQLLVLLVTFQTIVLKAQSLMGLNFDGNDDKATIQFNSPINAITIEGIFDCTSSQSYSLEQTIFQEGDSIHGIRIFLNANNGWLRACIDGNMTTCFANYDFRGSGCQSFALTYNNTTKQSRFFLSGTYTNGDYLVSSSPFNNSGKIILGSGEMSTKFKGNLKSFRRWNRILTDIEIASNYQGFTNLTQTNLIGNWSCEDGAGQTFLDLSGSGNSGVLGSTNQIEGSDPSWAAGCSANFYSNSSNGLQFDGTDDEVVIKADNFNIGDFTIEIIISNTVSQSYNFRQFFYTEGSVQDGVTMFVDIDGRIRGSVDGNYINLMSGFDARSAGCINLTLTYNATAKYARYYINGVYQNGEYFQANCSPINTSGKIFLGSSETGSQLFKGNLKEIRRWTRVLTDNEVIANYNNNIVNPVQSNLEGYWRCDNQNGQVFGDLSGHGHYAIRGISPQVEMSDPSFSTSACNICSSQSVVTINSSSTLILCPSSTITLTASGGSTYRWYKDYTLLQGSTSNQLDISTAGIYFVSGLSSCGTKISNIVTVVNSPQYPQPLSIVASGSTILCNGSSVTLIAPSLANMNYQWYLGTSTITGATSNSILAVQPGNYSVKMDNQCSARVQSNSIPITVNPLPDATLNISGTIDYCSNFLPVQIYPTSYGSNFKYQWYKNGIIISGEINRVYTASTAGSYTVKVTSLSLPYCGEQTSLVAAKINVTQTPSAPQSISYPGFINNFYGGWGACGTIDFNCTPVTNATDYIWYVVLHGSSSSGGATIISKSGTGAKISFPTNVAANTKYDVIVYAKNANCTSTTGTVIFINAGPTVYSTVVGPNPKCQNKNEIYTIGQSNSANPNANPLTGVSYVSWSVSGGNSQILSYSGTKNESAKIYSTTPFLITATLSGCGTSIASRNISSKTKCRTTDDTNDEILESAIEEEISIYPNPFNKNLNIEFISQSDQIALISLFDLSGRKIISQESVLKTGTNNIKIIADDLVDGIYFLEIHIGNRVKRLKLVSNEF